MGNTYDPIPGTTERIESVYASYGSATDNDRPYEIRVLLNRTASLTVTASTRGNTIRVNDPIRDEFAVVAVAMILDQRDWLNKQQEGTT